MADNRILENIKKLKALGMPDNEIIDNLIKIGLSKEESEKLVLEDKKDIKPKENNIEKKENNKVEETIDKKEKSNNNKEEKIKEKPAKEEIPDDFFTSKSGTVIDDSINNIDKEKDDKKESIEDLKEDLFLKDKKEQDTLDLNVDFKNKDLYDDSNDLYNKYTSENVDLENDNSSDDVWKKGFITIINSKLTELETKQKNIEKEISTTVKEEVNKIKEFHDKTKTEITKMINSILSEEMQKANTKIITELAKFKVAEAKLNSKVERIEEDKNKVQEIISSFDEIRKDFKVNLITTKKKTDALVEDTQENISKIVTTISTKLNEKIKEINSTLSLQSKITEGLVKNTKSTLITEIKKLNDFKENVEKQIDPKRIYDKVNELEDFKIKLANRYQERFEKVKNEFLQKAKLAINQEVENDLKELKTIKKEVVEKTDPERIDKKLKDLKIFEEELAESIDTKIEKSLKIYQASITSEFKNKMTEVEEFKKYLEKNVELQKTLEYKIKEVENFKKQFIAVIDENIEKMNRNMSLLMQVKKQN
jgi:polyhydroxyalkanoate synthesis regulator phasin